MRTFSPLLVLSVIKEICRRIKTEKEESIQLDKRLTNPSIRIKILGRLSPDGQVWAS